MGTRSCCKRCDPPNWGATLVDSRPTGVVDVDHRPRWSSTCRTSPQSRLPESSCPNEFHTAFTATGPPANALRAPLCGLSAEWHRHSLRRPRIAGASAAIAVTLARPAIRACTVVLVGSTVVSALADAPPPPETEHRSIIEAEAESKLSGDLWRPVNQSVTFVAGRDPALPNRAILRMSIVSGHGGQLAGRT
jgi:hypothetical protein